MARGAAAKRVVQIELPDAATEELAEKSQSEVEVEADIDAAAEEAVTVSQAIISRLDPSSGERYWLDSVHPKLISNQWLTEQFGGGAYEVVFKKPSQGKGPKRPHLTRRYKIDPDIPRKLPAKYHAPHPNGTALPSANGQSQPMSQNGSDIIGAGVLQIISSMQEASKTNAALTQAAIDRLNKPGPSLAEIAGIATPIVTALGTLVTAIITRPVPDPMAQMAAIAALTKGKDPTEMIAALAPLFVRQQNSDPNSVGAILAAVKDVVAIGRDLTPDQGSGNAYVDLARDVIHAVPTVASAFSAARNGGQPPAQPTNAPALPAGPPIPENGPLPPSKAASADDMLRIVLTPLASEIRQMAEHGSNPEMMAEFTIERYRGYAPAMRSFSDEPNYQDKLLGMFPELRPYEVWVRAFLAEMSDILHEPPTPPTQ